MCDALERKSVLSGPLGRKWAFNLIVNGQWSAQTARYLIQQLEMQAEWFEADEKQKADAKSG